MNNLYTHETDDDDYIWRKGMRDRYYSGNSLWNVPSFEIYKHEIVRQKGLPIYKQSQL